MPPVTPGLDVLVAERLDLLRGRRVALLANQASVGADLTHAVDRLAAADDVRLVALFGPEHGLRGEAQDMESVGSSTDEVTGLPVHSLYGDSAESLAPSAGMLAGVDVLVSKWALAWHAPGAGFVDVTDRMAAEFDPDEATLTVIRDLLEQDPVPLEDLKDEH